MLSLLVFIQLLLILYFNFRRSFVRVLVRIRSASYIFFIRTHWFSSINFTYFINFSRFIFIIFLFTVFANVFLNWMILKIDLYILIIILTYQPSVCFSNVIFSGNWKINLFIFINFFIIIIFLLMLILRTFVKRFSFFPFDSFCLLFLLIQSI